TPYTDTCTLSLHDALPICGARRHFKRSTRREVRRLPGSRRHRRLIQPATVWLPSIRTDTRAGTARVRARFRRAPVQPRMRSMAVIQVDIRRNSRSVKQLSAFVLLERGGPEVTGPSERYWRLSTEATLPQGRHGSTV